MEGSSKSLGFCGIREGGTLQHARSGTPDFLPLFIEITVSGDVESLQNPGDFRCLQKGLPVFGVIRLTRGRGRASF